MGTFWPIFGDVLTNLGTFWLGDVLTRGRFDCNPFWDAPLNKTEIHTHVTLDDFSPRSDMGDSLKNILNACFFPEMQNAGVKIGIYFEI